MYKLRITTEESSLLKKAPILSVFDAIFLSFYSSLFCQQRQWFAASKHNHATENVPENLSSLGWSDCTEYRLKL